MRHYRVLESFHAQWHGEWHRAEAGEVYLIEREWADWIAQLAPGVIQAVTVAELIGEESHGQ